MRAIRDVWSLYSGSVGREKLPLSGGVGWDSGVGGGILIWLAASCRGRECAPGRWSDASKTWKSEQVRFVLGT